MKRFSILALALVMFAGGAVSAFGQNTSPDPSKKTTKKKKRKKKKKSTDASKSTS